MGPWAYYCPLWLGALLVLALNEPLRGAVPTWTPTAQWFLVAGVAVAAGLQSQVLMFGVQGAFAQVLPLPWGRSIRGGGAAGAGWLLIAWVGLSATTVLLSTDGVTTGAMVVAGISLVALGGALAVYFWNVPAAVTDFRKERI